MDIFYNDGEFVSSDRAVIPVTDMGLLRGYAIFDFLRTYNGVPFHLKDHVRRLENSARLVQIELKWSGGQIYDIVLETLNRNNHQESNIRIVITGGDSLDSITPVGDPRLIVMVTPVVEFPSAWYAEGVKIITVNTERHIPGAKSTNYIAGIISQKMAKAQDAVEAVYVDKKGRVLECTTTNIFMVRKGKVSTPIADILPGITRQVVIDILNSKYRVQEREIKIDEMLKSDGVFLTSSNKEIVPVVQIDGNTIGNGRVEGITLDVIDLFKNYTRNYK